ncbi:MAG: hypothetical protein B6D68_00405, partial [spirochete symbiont of Stewartia floridana]
MRVHILSESVARRIAAGEVVDRPHAVVRELLDNAIDAKADDIKVHLRHGGVEEIRITDNGHGMSKDDLSLCWLPHATSKISTLDDLEKTATLGFRGEALASLAACSRVEITSAADESTHRLSVHGGKIINQEPSTGPRGTTVSIRDLFFNMPARRQFLKSTMAETRLCRQVFLEKAAAHPEQCFRLFIDGQLKTYLQKDSILGRVTACWPGLAPMASWWISKGEFEDLDITVVHVRPEISRKDRQQIKIFANRRRIDEFSLVQGVVHAYDALMPGGTFPIALVFIEINPCLVDFNIHPGKKEARFKDLPLIRHRLIEIIKNRLNSESYEKRLNPPAAFKETNQLFSGESMANRKSSASIGMTAHDNSASFRNSGPFRQNQADAFVSATKELREKGGNRRERFNPFPLEKNIEFRYIGQAFGLFLLAEAAGTLFIVDQHAAHERILFEKLRNSEPASEHLLIPRRLHLNQTALMRLELRREGLEKLGLVFNCNKENEWEMTGLPHAARGLEDELVDFIENDTGDPENLHKELWADIACKAALKSNDLLDDDTARRLLHDAFNLDSPRCPHGRPIWFEISKQELFDCMGRNV